MSQSPSPLYRYTFEGAEFDEAKLELKVDGEPKTIEPRPLEVLAQLMRRPGEVMSREELVELLWDGRPSAPNVLANAVKKLRTALGERAAVRIVTMGRMGYRFDGPVAREAVGRREATETLVLEPGQPVPGRGDAYKLVRKLGRSSRHPVWRAWNAGLKLHRVFKFATDGEQLAALKRELTLSRFLQASLGPREDLAVVLDANFHAEPYYVEFPDLGTDLLEWSSSGQLEMLNRPQRLALFLQIARTVDDAHALGVLHKDIKPSNILVRGEAGAWRTTLVDFGAGRLLDRRPLEQLDLTVQGLTVTNAVGEGLQGTYLYMAPELLQGQPPTVRSDLYALGVLLFQLLVGDLSRPQSTGWQRLVDDELLVADITAATEGVPQERMASVGELMNRVGQLALRHRQRERQAEQDADAQRTRQALEKARLRRPWMWALVSSLVLGLAGVGAFYGQSIQSLNEAKRQATRAEAITDFLTDDLFRAADLSQPTRANQPARTPMDVLTRAADNAAERFRNQPETEAQIREKLGDAFGQQQNRERAEAEYRRAIELSTGRVAETDPRLLRLRLRYASALTRVAKADAARQQIDLVKGNASRRLLDEHPALEAALFDAQCAYFRIAEDYQQALAAGLQHLALLRRLPEATLRQKHGALMTAAVLLAHDQQLERAAALAAEATQEPYGVQTIGAYQLAYGKLMHAYLMIKTRDSAQAAQDLADASRIYEPLSGMSRAFEYHLRLTEGFVQELQGALAPAALAYERAHQFGVSHGVIEAMTARLKKLYVRVYQREPGQPLAELRRLREEHLATPAPKRNPAFLASQTDLHLARALSDTGAFSEAWALLKDLQPERLDAEDPMSTWRGRLKAEQARALKGMGQVQQAEALQAEALEHLQRERTPAWVLAMYR